MVRRETQRRTARGGGAACGGGAGAGVWRSVLAARRERKGWASLNVLRSSVETQVWGLRAVGFMHRRGTWRDAY
jgi:hypothetical protein